MANEQDKDNDMQENKKDKSRKSAILTGVICVLLCIIGALYIWHKQTQKPPVQLDVNSAIAFTMIAFGMILSVSRQNDEQSHDTPRSESIYEK